MSTAELFSLPFMQRALLAALFTGLAAPAVGTYLVQRRLALMGDGIGHVAVTGVAVGLLTGWSPTWTAVVVAVLGAVAIELIRERGHTNGDVALALLFYGGLAGGVLLPVLVLWLGALGVAGFAHRTRPGVPATRALLAVALCIMPALLVENWTAVMVPASRT